MAKSIRVLLRRTRLVLVPSVVDAVRVRWPVAAWPRNRVELAPSGKYRDVRFEIKTEELLELHHVVTLGPFETTTSYHRRLGWSRFVETWDCCLDRISDGGTDGR
uniref:RxLR effector candidate protein n=1 Tax=Hyaloperonospora arabidopsidis (strain Emoy2) TaxID=559515 RepID=M4BQI8_HYAAE